MGKSDGGAGLVPGTVVADRYRIDAHLGEGGMGVVVAATDLRLKRPVALKFMLPSLASSRDAGERFEREAHASVKLTSEHTARVFDVCKSEQGPFMVMELLEGSDLASMLAQGERLPVDRAVDYVLQACDAIAEAHSAGIVHRDLKPQNLFLARRPNGRQTVKVLDFGISKIIAEDKVLTQTRATLGSPLYMAPEQMRSARVVDGRADIWALGVILFELLTGEPPFNAESLQELTLMIAQDPVPDPASLRADIPGGLASAIVRCLEKEPSTRFATVADLVAAIAPFGPDGVRPSAVGVATAWPSRHAAAFSPTMPALDRTMASTGTDVEVPAPGVIAATERRMAVPGQPAATHATWGRTDDGARSARRRVVPILAGGALVGLAIGVAVIASRSAKTVAPKTAAAVAPIALGSPTPTPIPISTPILSLTPIPTPASTPASTPTSTPPHTATPPPPPHPSRPRPHPAPSSAPSPGDPLQKKW